MGTLRAANYRVGRRLISRMRRNRGGLKQKRPAHRSSELRKAGLEQSDYTPEGGVFSVPPGGTGAAGPPPLVATWVLSAEYPAIEPRFIVSTAELGTMMSAPFSFSP